MVDGRFLVEGRRSLGRGCTMAGAHCDVASRGGGEGGLVGRCCRLNGCLFVCEESRGEG